MGILDSFISFTRGLTGERRQAIEAELAALMESYSIQYALTPEEIAEIDRRLAEPHPKYASPDEIERIFGKPFSK